MTSPAHRRPARVLAVAALTAPLAATLLAATVSPAHASTSTTASVALSPNQTVLTSPTQMSAKGTITYKRTNTISDPTSGGGGSFYVYGPDGFSKNQPISSCSTGSLGTSCSSSTTLVVYASDMQDRSNGPWPVKIKDVTQTTFYTNFPPTANPENLAAAANGTTEVDLSWSYGGTEPDKAGFEVVETQGSSTRTLTAPASACNGTSCGYAITYPAPAPNTTESFSYTVTALRSSGGCSSCGDYTRSAPSSSATAQLVGPPPPPSPTPTPSASGGTTGSTTGGSTGSTTGSTSTTGGTTGSSTSGGTTGSHTSTGGSTSTAGKPIIIPTLPPLVASRRAFALGFNHFSPSLGIPKLPPLPATNFPVTAAGSEAYNPTLPYTPQPRKTTSVLSSPLAAITDSVDTAQLAKSLAVALILLVAAAHVRIFLSHGVED